MFKKIFLWDQYVLILYIVSAHKNALNHKHTTWFECVKKGRGEHHMACNYMGSLMGK